MKKNKKTDNVPRGTNKDLEDWEREEDTSRLETCHICGIVVEKGSVDSYGRPMCEFCKQDYKQMMDGFHYYRNKKNNNKDEDNDDDD